ncbi:helix-turn-helix domain-containing protein [Streptomyces sp. WAC00469]|nr:helix-turn-helix domain-containing protein [Streptomyces sp. WAC00469]
MTPPENGEFRRSGGGHGNPWPQEKRLEAAALLARGLSAAEASRQTGIPERTVREWRADPEFASVVTQLRGELLEEATAALVALGRLAVDTLGHGMRRCAGRRRPGRRKAPGRAPRGARPGAFLQGQPSVVQVTAWCRGMVRVSSVVSGGGWSGGRCGRRYHRGSPSGRPGRRSRSRAPSRAPGSWRTRCRSSGRSRYGG